MGRKRVIKLSSLIEVGIGTNKKKVKSVAKVEKAPPIKCIGKRSTKMMFEVIPWARGAKYNELAAVTE